MHNKCLYNKLFIYLYLYHYIIQQGHFNLETLCNNKIEHLYYYHKKLQELSPNSIKIYYKSLVDKYINQHERLNDLCLVEVVANYDTKLNKKMH
jgi:hypothetical protein